MDFDQWLAYWGSAESPPQRGRIHWHSPAAWQRPFSTHTAADYALDETEDTPAGVSADDGNNPGLRADALPDAADLRD